MMFSDSDLDDEVLIQRLIESVPCSECGSPYTAHDVHIVAQDETAWTLVAYCSECGVECLVKAFVDDEADAYPPPDSDEVVAFGRFLAGFHGDLRALLEL
jgi:hypothetical protein